MRPLCRILHDLHDLYDLYDLRGLARPIGPRWPWMTVDAVCMRRAARKAHRMHRKGPRDAAGGSVGSRIARSEDQDRRIVAQDDWTACAELQRRRPGAAGSHEQG